MGSEQDPSERIELPAEQRLSAEEQLDHTMALSPERMAELRAAALKGSPEPEEPKKKRPKVEVNLGGPQKLTEQEQMGQTMAFKAIKKEDFAKGIDVELPAPSKLSPEQMENQTGAIPSSPLASARKWIIDQWERIRERFR